MFASRERFRQLLYHDILRLGLGPCRCEPVGFDHNGE